MKQGRINVSPLLEIGWGHAVKGDFSLPIAAMPMKPFASVPTQRLPSCAQAWGSPQYEFLQNSPMEAAFTGYHHHCYLPLFQFE